MRDVAPQDVSQHQKSHGAEHETQDACDLQRQGREPGHHVDGVGDEFAEAVTRIADRALVLANAHSAEVGGSPGEQHVDVDRGAAVRIESVSQPGSEDAERTHLAGRFGAHGTLQGELGDPRCLVAHEAVCLVLGRSIDDVATVGHFSEQLGNLFGRVLQIVVDRHDQLALRGADAAQQRVVLPVVARQLDASNPRVVLGERLDHRPRIVATAVFDEDDFKLAAERPERRDEPAMQLAQDVLRPVHRNHDRHAGWQDASLFFQLAYRARAWASGVSE